LIFYKRMHWEVCKTSEEQCERDFLGELGEESEKKGGKFSQESLGTNPKGGISVLSSPSFLFSRTGRTAWICTGRTKKNWAQKSRHVLAWFLRQLLKNFLKDFSHTRGNVQQPIVGTFSEVTFSTNPYICTDCGTIFKGVCGWDNFVL
jgi:hypothetical protein